MEKLDDLPTKENAQPSPEQHALMDKFFGEAPEEKGFMEKMQLKKVFAFVIAFGLLANPWVDGLLSKIPYLSNGVAVFGVKMVIFFIAALLINWLL